MSATATKHRPASPTETEPPDRSLTQPDPLAGFGHLLRFMIRRDRVRAPLWFAGVVGLFTAMAASVVGLYSTPAELVGYAQIATGDVALKAITGPGYGLEQPTQGVVVMNEAGVDGNRSDRTRPTRYRERLTEAAGTVNRWNSPMHSSGPPSASTASSSPFVATVAHNRPM